MSITDLIGVAKIDLTHCVYSDGYTPKYGLYPYDYFVVEVEGEEWFMDVDWHEAKKDYNEALSIGDDIEQKATRIYGINL